MKMALWLVALCMIVGCAQDTVANPNYALIQAEGTQDFKRNPRPVELHCVTYAATPNGPLAVTYFGAAFRVVPDTVWICQVYHPDPDSCSVVSVVLRSQYVTGWWLDSQEEFEWPEE